MESPNFPVFVPKSITIIPDRVMVKLTYWGIKNFVIGIGTATAAYRWRPSAPFDVDPLVGGTSTPGFNEWAALYGSYRAVSSRFRAKFSNPSVDQACALVILPLNNDPGASPTAAVINTWVGNSYAKHVTCALAGGPISGMTNNMSTEKIYGSKMVYFDDNFSSPVNAVPNNNWFWAVGIIYQTGVTKALSPALDTEITMYVEFFSRLNQIA